MLLFTQVVSISCNKDTDPIYSARMLRITEEPWRWVEYRVQENNGPWVIETLPSGVLDNYYTFLPYENETDVPEIMEIDYGSDLCSSNETIGFKKYDYWGLYENETKIKASGWGGTIEPGEILELSRTTFKILFTYQDCVSIRKTEITLAR